MLCVQTTKVKVDEVKRLGKLFERRNTDIEQNVFHIYSKRFREAFERDEAEEEEEEEMERGLENDASYFIASFNHGMPLYLIFLSEYDNN